MTFLSPSYFICKIGMSTPRFTRLLRDDVCRGFGIEPGTWEVLYIDSFLPSISPPPSGHREWSPFSVAHTREKPHCMFAHISILNSAAPSPSPHTGSVHLYLWNKWANKWIRVIKSALYHLRQFSISKDCVCLWQPRASHQKLLLSLWLGGSEEVTDVGAPERLEHTSCWAGATHSLNTRSSLVKWA